MGVIARIIDSYFDLGALVCKIQSYANDNSNARVFSPSGVDSRPLDDDVCYTEDSRDIIGGKDILGYADPSNEPVSEKGECRIYARDTEGLIVGSLHLKNDGKLEININADADLNIGNNATINISGNTNIVSTGDMTIESPNVKIVGNLSVSGSIESDLEITGGAASTPIELTKHPHLGNLAYNTGPPVAVGGGVAPPGSPPSFDQGDNTIDMGNQDIKNVSGISTTIGTHTHPVQNDPPTTTGDPT